MNPLISAVLEHRLDDVRRLAKERPELLSEPSDAGTLPLDVAQSSGDPQIYAALLRVGAPGKSTRPDHAELLRAYMVWLAESFAAATWLNGQEYELWGRMMGEDVGAGWFERLDRESLEDLKFLEARGEGWWKADAFVPRKEWVKAYASWKASTRE